MYICIYILKFLLKYLSLSQEHSRGESMKMTDNDFQVLLANWGGGGATCKSVEGWNIRLHSFLHKEMFMKTQINLSTFIYVCVYIHIYPLPKISIFIFSQRNTDFHEVDEAENFSALPRIFLCLLKNIYSHECTQNIVYQ